MGDRLKEDASFTANVNMKWRLQLSGAVYQGPAARDDDPEGAGMDATNMVPFDIVLLVQLHHFHISREPISRELPLEW